jgi:GT2 family glycosyltransferase
MIDRARPVPRFSVVVPTYRRHGALERCLAALARQSYPRELYEVIVADDGSGDPPHAVVSRYADRLSVTLVEAPHGGPGAARNAGAARARGTYLAFTDDDCEPAADWLAALARHFDRHPGAAFGGRVENALGANPFATASQLLMSYLYDYYAPATRDRRRFFTTNNLALPARAFAALGGFDRVDIRETAEDRDLCDRWIRSGGELAYAHDAEVRHWHELALGSFWRQHYHYGRGAVYFHRARRRRAADAVDLEPPTFYLGMLDYPRRRGLGWRAPMQAGLLTLTQVAYVTGYVVELVAMRLRGA